MKIIKKNKRAAFDYFLLKRFIAGIILTGPEVKAIKLGHIDITETFARFYGNELFLINALISKSSLGIELNRNKKLLLHKKEMQEIRREMQSKGVTIIPVSIGLDHGLLKIEIAAAKGKKQFDKREVIQKREAERMLRGISLEKFRYKQDRHKRP